MRSQQNFVDVFLSVMTTNGEPICRQRCCHFDAVAHIAIDRQTDRCVRPEIDRCTCISAARQRLFTTAVRVARYLTHRHNSSCCSFFVHWSWNFASTSKFARIATWRVKECGSNVCLFTQFSSCTCARFEIKLSPLLTF